MVPCHSFGDEVAEIVCSNALCKYPTGLGSEEDISRSASRAQKCNISLDHKLDSSAQ